MPDIRNDELDRNRNTPQDRTPNTPLDQDRDDMNRDREQGDSVTDRGRTGTESFNEESRNRGPLDTDRDRDIERGPNDISE
jgi:hypothetical protein